jgi:hypothetical protein
MKRWMCVLVLAATSAAAQVNVARVADDAVVLDRVAEVSRRDLPSDLLRRMLNEDIELLRGPRPDGTYQYASWERLEGGRTSNTYTIQEGGEKTQTVELRAPHVYRVILDSPGRRMLVARNRPVHVERVDIEYIPAGSTVSKVHSVAINAALVPGQNHPIDLPDIARQATVRVIARTQEGYGNLSLALVQARIVDRADSPYADTIASAKAALRGIDNADIPSIRAMAMRMRDSLGARTNTNTTSVPAPATRTVEVTAPREEAAPSPEIYLELQAIEDLLTGNDTERREGLDKLHQLLRRLRPRQ